MKDKNGKTIKVGDTVRYFHHYDSYGKKSVDEYLTGEVNLREGKFVVGNDIIIPETSFLYEVLLIK